MMANNQQNYLLVGLYFLIKQGCRERGRGMRQLQPLLKHIIRYTLYITLKKEKTELLMHTCLK